MRAGQAPWFYTSRAEIYRSVLVPRNTWFYSMQTHSISIEVESARHFRIRVSLPWVWSPHVHVL